MAVALVTGAAGGIGAAVAESLATAGTAVALADVAADELSRRCDELTGRGHRARAYRLDVRDRQAVDEVAAQVEAELGPITVLVNVAGVLRTGPVTELTDEDWAAVMAVNATGVFHCCRAVARRMRPRRAGAIVTVGSNAAGVPRMHMAAYAAAKAAATHFTCCLGLELAGDGIRCNVVAPGSTDTAMLRSMWTDADETGAVIDGSPSTYKVGIPLRRLAQPDDIADAVAFLVSPRARHITMQVLYVDGGAALRA